MPINKDAYSRYRIIDRLLRKNSFVKTSQMVEVCSESLGINISPRTIQKDINDLREDSSLRIDAPIKYSHSQKAFYYPDDVDEIFPALELGEEEISALLFYAQTQDQYRTYGIFKDIGNAISKVLDAANIKDDYKNAVINRPFIQTERTPPLKGNELILKIIHALKGQLKLSFEYKKFDSDEKKKRVISPYLLKEDRHMWYVIGCLEGKNKVSTFAVDRMRNVKIVNEAVFRIEFNSDEYFKYSLGVMVSEGEPIEVILSFTPHQGNYIKALPIHESQKILIDSDAELRISITIKPAYEFYMKILGYGSSVRVISPQEIIHEVRDMLKMTIDQYG